MAQSGLVREDLENESARFRGRERRPRLQGGSKAEVQQSKAHLRTTCLPLMALIVCLLGHFAGLPSLRRYACKSCCRCGSPMQGGNRRRVSPDAKVADVIDRNRARHHSPPGPSLAAAIARAGQTGIYCNKEPMARLPSNCTSTVPHGSDRRVLVVLITVHSMRSGASFVMLR